MMKRRQRAQVIRIARESGAALILIHAGKRRPGGDASDLDSILGSTALTASADNLFPRLLQRVLRFVQTLCDPISDLLRNRIPSTTVLFLRKTPVGLGSFGAERDPAGLGINKDRGFREIRPDSLHAQVHAIAIGASQQNANIARLTQRRQATQSKLDRGYDDYLEGRLSESLWMRKSSDWESELATIDVE